MVDVHLVPIFMDFIEGLSMNFDIHEIEGIDEEKERKHLFIEILKML